MTGEIRRRDELFETVAEVCDIDWHGLTKSGRGALNRAVGELREVDATPDEVRFRAGNWPWDIRLTPNGLAKHWAGLSKVTPKPSANTRRAAALADQLEAQGL